MEQSKIKVNSVHLSLAWQQFQKESNCILEVPENAYSAKSLIESFRSVRCTPKDIDDSVYYHAGARAESANLLNKELEQKFPKFKVQKASKRLRMDQAIFYGALYKNLKLAYPFYNIPGKIMHFCRVKVPCFEAMDQNQRSQIFVLKYTNEDNFFIRINLLEKDSQMFVLMSKNKCTMEEVFELVSQSDMGEAQPMTSNDVFKIPQLRIEASHSITDLSGVKIRFDGNDDKRYEIASMEEHVTISMPGVIQKDMIEELTLTVPEFETPKLKQRRMCLRDPFWVVLRYKGCQPYFAMYVNKANDCI